MKTVKLKMLTSGPNRNYAVGDVVEVDELRAQILCQDKDAEPVGGDKWRPSTGKTASSTSAVTTSAATTTRSR